MLEETADTTGGDVAGYALSGKTSVALHTPSWMAHLDHIVCLRLHGDEERITGVEVWYRGDCRKEPSLTLQGEEAEQLVSALWHRDKGAYAGRESALKPPTPDTATRQPR